MDIWEPALIREICCVYYFLLFIRHFNAKWLTVGFIDTSVRSSRGWTVNGLHLYTAFLTSGHSYPFTIPPNIHPFMQTFTKRRRSQPRRATAGRWGAVRVRWPAHGPLAADLAGARGCQSTRSTFRAAVACFRTVSGLSDAYGSTVNMGN